MVGRVFYIGTKKLVEQARIKQSRNCCKSSFLIVEEQSVKNTDSTQEKGYAADKKVSEIKRYIAVDTQGLPYAFAITAANITDRQGALLAFKQHQEELEELKGILCAEGYMGNYLPME